MRRAAVTIITLVILASILTISVGCGSLAVFKAKEKENSDGLSIVGTYNGSGYINEGTSLEFKAKGRYVITDTDLASGETKVLSSGKYGVVEGIGMYEGSDGKLYITKAEVFTTEDGSNKESPFPYYITRSGDIVFSVYRYLKQ